MDAAMKEFWDNIIAWFVAAILAFLAPLLLAGCDMPNLGTRTFKDVGELLDKPVVQASLERWSAKAETHDPYVHASIVTEARLGVVGVDVEGDVTGSQGRSGLDADLYERFMEIADRFDQLFPPEDAEGPGDESEQPGGNTDSGDATE